MADDLDALIAQHGGKPAPLADKIDALIAEHSGKPVSAAATPPSAWEQFKSLPAAYLDVVRREAETGNASPIPGLPSVSLEALKSYPTAAKVLGGVIGTTAGIPAGPAGMIAGGASGTSIADSLSQLAQTGTPQAPPSATDALLRSGGAVAEGALTGATGAGTLKAAPPVLRFLASPAGQAVVGGTTSGAGALLKTGSPITALKAAGVGAATGGGGALALKRLGLMNPAKEGAEYLANQIEGLTAPPPFRSISSESMPASLRVPTQYLEQSGNLSRWPKGLQAVAPRAAEASEPSLATELLGQAEKPLPTASQAPSGPTIEPISGLPLNPDGTVDVPTYKGGPVLRVDASTLNRSGRELATRPVAVSPQSLPQTPSAAESLLAESRPVSRGNPMSIGTKVSVDVGPKTYEAEIVRQPNFGSFDVKLPDGTIINRLRKNITIAPVGN